MTKQTNPEVSAKPTRRTFSAAEKRRILAAADALKAAGENLGPMLRREGLYRSQLSDWRKAIAARGDEGLTPSKRGPKGTASPTENTNVSASILLCLPVDHCFLAAACDGGAHRINTTQGAWLLGRDGDNRFSWARPGCQALARPVVRHGTSRSQRSR